MGARTSRDRYKGFPEWAQGQCALRFSAFLHTQHLRLNTRYPIRAHRDSAQGCEVFEADITTPKRKTAELAFAAQRGPVRRSHNAPPIVLNSRLPAHQTVMKLGGQELRRHSGDMRFAESS